MITVAEAPPVLVELRDATIRMRDVVPGIGGRVASVPIARLPDGRREITLSSVALAALVRRAVPGRATPRVATVMRFRRAASPPLARCFAARAPIAVGTAITRALVEPAQCERPIASVRYRNGVVVANAPIARGGNVGATISEVDLPIVARGAALVLRTRHGVVTVEKDVTALQAARDGGRVFVRDRYGQVFAAPVRVEAR